MLILVDYAYAVAVSELINVSILLLCTSVFDVGQGLLMLLLLILDG
jgi:hypothetical protein